MGGGRRGCKGGGFKIFIMIRSVTVLIMKDQCQKDEKY